jgi:signal peptidase I
MQQSSEDLSKLSSQQLVPDDHAPTDTGDSAEASQRSLARSAKSWLRETLESIIPAVIIVLLINAFLAQATRVEGQSMEPSLHNDERLIIEKVSYRLRPPERGEIVVLQIEGRQSAPLIKRIIGLPGETVEIHDGKVFIDGEALEEPYLAYMTYGSMPPRVVPEEHVFLLGDNRSASNDSRFFGMVSFDQIVGRAWLRYWPLDQAGLVEP